MQRIKIYILTLPMLLALIVGAGNHLYTMLSACNNSIHMGVGEHHECGSCCEKHFPDCVNHTSSFDHQCDSTEFSLSVFIPSVESRVDRGCNAPLLYRIVEQSDSNLAIVDQQLSWLYSLFDDPLFDSFDPSTGALRAPPVLG
ncbi:MAG: hypothetical protein SNG35_00375 [Rikenellaceae bacterium]